MARNDKNITLEDVTIAFRNFEGKEGPYNAAGTRNFAIFLEPNVAERMAKDGWNVKQLKPRDDEEDGQPYVTVAVSYKNRPPKIGLVTSKGLTYLGEEEVEMLDWVDIETADVTLNPFEWVVNGKTGVKAYLQTLFVKIEEDYLQMKWTAIVEDSKKLAIEAAPDYIEGEYAVGAEYELT